MTKKLFYFVLMWCFVFVGFSQNIQIFEPVNDPSENDNEFTLFQLIDEVLIQGDCKIVDNVESPNNSRDSGATFDSYAYFDGSGTSFPFEDGIVLASNNVTTIPSNPSGNLSGTVWTGDPDLDNLAGPEESNNATVITFDFVPFQEFIEFNYLMASMEYNTFVCSYADVFAFILSGPGIDNENFYNIDANPNNEDVAFDLGGLNIATLPGTNIPATITNIHNGTSGNANNCASGSLGEFAASQFYAGNSTATGYNGRTVPLTASADVIAGETYTIKLAVGDYRDTILPTAVFLEGQSFDIGIIDLGDDLTFANPQTECDGDPILLESGFPDDSSILQYAWTRNGDEIEGADGPDLTVDETGFYVLFVFVVDPNGNIACFNSGNVFVDFFPKPEVNLSSSELVCPDESVILDATPANLDNINVAIEDAEQIIQDIIDNPDIDIEDVDIIVPELSYQWYFNGEPIEGATDFTYEPNEPGIYELDVEFANCFDTYTVEVDLVEFEVVEQIESISACFSEGQEINALIEPEIEFFVPSQEEANPSFLWSTGETTPTIEVGEPGTYELTVTVNGCEETTSYEVDLFEAHTVFIENKTICFDELETTFESGYNNSQDGTSVVWSLPNETTQTSSNLNLSWANSGEAETLEGEYAVTVTINDCEVTDVFEFNFTRQDDGEGEILQSCIIPEGISPNGDGINDSFDLAFLDDILGVEKVQIFNRYGRKVYESSNTYRNEFFGQDQGGNNLVTGTYFYVIKLKESNDSFSQTEKGWLYINREQQ